MRIKLSAVISNRCRLNLLGQTAVNLMSGYGVSLEDQQKLINLIDDMYDKAYSEELRLDQEIKED